MIEAFSTSGTERGYPPSIGSAVFRGAVGRWIDRRFDVDVPIGADRRVHRHQGVRRHPAAVAAPAKPDRDTVLYPATSYPTYEMGAILAGCRPVAVPMRPAGGVDLGAIDPADAERALALWVNSPGNPTGVVDDLGAAAAWGRPTTCRCSPTSATSSSRGTAPAAASSQHGLDGVVAVHSLSKRSNLAGGRIGFYAGDPDLVHYLQEVRKHVGMMVPGPAQAAGIVALDDDAHVEVQRRRYRRRLVWMAEILGAWSGRRSPLPAGGFYLWIPVDDGWAFAERLAAEAGAIVSPGEFYGAAPRTTCASPWYNLTIASSWSPSGWGSDGGRQRARTMGRSAPAIVLGVVGGALLWLFAGQRYDDAIADLAPAPVGCDITLVFDRAGPTRCSSRPRARSARSTATATPTTGPTTSATTTHRREPSLLDDHGEEVDLDRGRRTDLRPGRRHGGVGPDRRDRRDR